ncbi:MAG: hypothetical protein PVH91_14175, partial [Pseudomonadales bacterium]
EEEWEPFRMNLALVMQSSAYRGHWDGFQIMFSSEFRDELNSILGSKSFVDVAAGFGVNPQ